MPHRTFRTGEIVNLELLVEGEADTTWRNADPPPGHPLVSRLIDVRCASPRYIVTFTVPERLLAMTEPGKAVMRAEVMSDRPDRPDDLHIKVDGYPRGLVVPRACVVQDPIIAARNAAEQTAEWIETERAELRRLYDLHPELGQALAALRGDR